MPTPLPQLKAEFFKTLAHPMRVRVLELLAQRDHTVAELLSELGVEPSHLSQQLGVLRRSGLVTARREASTVHYSLASPKVGELLAVARSILATLLSDQLGVLNDLRAESPAPAAAGSRSRARPPRPKGAPAGAS